MSTSTTARKAGRIGVISLGCAKNLVDTEVMLGHLRQAGWETVGDPSEADVLLVNTCSFIEEAREESVQAILEAARYKTRGRARRLVVAGCLVQRYRESLTRELPEVDAFVGLDELHRIVEAAGGSPAGGASTALLSIQPAAASREMPAHPQPATYLYDGRTPRVLATPPWTAYVKIAEGCDHTCAFCAIPSFRGRFRSRPPEDIVGEARALAARGVVEINLIAQDSSRYGRDLAGETDLARLLEALNGVDGLRWIRVHYLYPNTIGPRLVDTMAALDKVVPYVDLPLQHADPGVLQRMRRGGSADQHLRLLERFRRAMPDVTLRSTFIVGFPGEDDRAFETLLGFLREAGLDYAGFFTYSHEEGTPAGALADDVPKEIKRERLRRAREVQAAVTESRLQRWIGRELDVLVEGTHPESELLVTGRSMGQARDADGVVILPEAPDTPGRFVRARIARVAGCDLVAAGPDA